MREILRGLYGQLVVMDALMLRETRTRFGRNKLGYLWAIAEPVIGILIFFGMYTLAGRSSAGGMDLFLFLTTGFVPYGLFAKALGATATAVSANLAMLFYPQVKPIDLILARTGLEFATHSYAFALLWAVHAAIWGLQPIHDPALFLMGMVLAATLGCSVGTFFTAMGPITQTAERIRAPLMRPLFWVSGLFFSYNDLPLEAQKFLIYNPVLHCIEMIRGGMFETYDASHASPLYVAQWSLAFAFIGLTLERRVRHRIQMT